MKAVEEGMTAAPGAAPGVDRGAALARGRAALLHVGHKLLHVEPLLVVTIPVMAADAAAADAAKTPVIVLLLLGVRTPVTVAEVVIGVVTVAAATAVVIEAAATAVAVIVAMIPVTEVVAVGMTAVETAVEIAVKALTR